TVRHDPTHCEKICGGELDWIVMRTLEKDRGRRYDSASALADDVDRYLSDQPVEASPPSILYRTYKAYRRNRIACLAGALIAGSLILATGISLVALRDSWRMTQIAMEQGQVATQQAAKAEAEQERAEGFARQASDQARASQSTLELVVELLAKTGINPKTGSEYTVSEALKLLTESNTRKNGKFNLPPAVAAQLHMGLGNAYRRSGVNRLAAIHFQQAVDITQKRPGEQSLVHAKALRYLGASQGSPESIRAAIEIETKRQSTRDVVTSQTLLGQMLGRSEETQSEAIELLEKACSQFEPQPNVELSEIPHFVIAEVLHKLGRQVDAKRYEAKAVEQAIDCFGGSRTIWHRLGESLRDRKRFRDSNRALLVADSLWPESQSDEPAFHIGLNYRELLDYRQAEYYLQKSLRLATARDDAYRVRSARYHLATTLAEQSKSERAVPLLKTLLNDTQARNHRSLACLITLAVDSPGLSEWLVSYRRRLESEVNEDPLAKILLAKIELADGDIARVKELLGGSNLSNAGQQWHRFFATGHFDEARDYALNWLEVIPSHNLRQRTWKTVGVARSHYHIGDLKAGEDLLRRAIKKAERMDPIDPFTLYWVKYELALILHAQGRTDEARPLCRDVFKATEESAKNKVTIWNDDYYDRITQWHALCLSGIEYDADQWVQNLQRYLRLDDSEKARGACHSLLADHFGQRRDTQRTIYHYERESLTRPLDFRILPFQYCRDRLVNLYLQTGQIDRGRNHFAKVLDRVDKGLPTKHPHRAFTRMRLAKLYLEQPAKPAKAQELLIESKTILERNSMTPDQVMQQIDELLARTGK
ncbi:MAG: tetratricopeptide repeat protein, partial [Planctomycetota bacterium]